MRREPFASAAGVKWRRCRELALLAAGLAPVVATDGRADRAFAQTVAARLTRGESFLVWQIDDVVVSGSTVATLDRASFERLVAGVPQERRSLAIRSSDAVDAVDAWDFFQNEKDSADLRAQGWTYWVSARARDLALPARPPLVIGYFADTVAGEVAARLAEDEDLHPAFSPSVLSRQAPHCAIHLLIDQDLELATQHASRGSAAVGGSSCDLCVVLLKEGIPDHPRIRPFLRLRETLKAGGLLVGKGGTEEALELARTLIDTLTEETPLWQRRFSTQAGPALLLCDERVATHRLATWTPESDWATRASALSGAVAAHKSAVPPAHPAGAKKHFPFLPSAGELKRGEGGSGQRAEKGLRRIFGGPRRRQGGAAPFEPRRAGPAEEGFGKTKGAPEGSTGGSGWIAPAPDLTVADGDRIGDVTPGKARTHGPNSKVPTPVPQAARTAAESPEAAPAPAPGAAASPAPATLAPATGTEGPTMLAGRAEEELALGADDGAWTAVLHMGDDPVRAFATAFETAMSEVASEPSSYEGLRATGTPECLRALARAGASLRGVLERDGGPSAGVTRVLVTSERPVEVLPLEYLYALEPPDDDAPICDRAEEGLRAEGEQLVGGWCPGCAPTERSPDDQRRLLCPLAFWGARCTIERRGPGHEHTDPAGVLHPLRRAVVGTTERVDAPDAEGFAAGIRGSVGAIEEALDWSDWEYAVKRSPAPTMLALLAHLKHDARFGTPQLEIGVASTLGINGLRLTHVRSGEDAPPPLAILLGSRTSLTTSGFARFAASMREMGAVVVSSVAIVEAREATSVAVELVSAIARVTRAVPVEELVMHARRRLLADGTPAVLSLIALADADWSADAER